MENIVKALTAVALVGMGMTGLYFKVEYSGWVLLGGLVVASTL